MAMMAAKVGVACADGAAPEIPKRLEWVKMGQNGSKWVKMSQNGSLKSKNTIRRRVLRLHGLLLGDGNLGGANA